MPTRVLAEINVYRGQERVWCTFLYDEGFYNRLMYIPGAKYMPHRLGGPAISLPLDIETMRKVRSEIGNWLTLGPKLYAWGTAKVAVREQLTALATGTEAELERLPRVNPGLYKRIYCGPKAKGQDDAWCDAYMAANPPSYQTADVKFLASHPNPINTNGPGTGKTIELIAAVFESGLENGPKLIITPKTSVTQTWPAHLKPYGGDQPVLLAVGDRAQRLMVLEQAVEYKRVGQPFWLVVNPQMVQLQRQRIEDESGNYLGENLLPKFPMLFDFKWNAIIFDEFHKGGVRSDDTVTYAGLKELHAVKKMPASGTPFGGRPIKLFPMLQWCMPDEHRSKNQWAERWLVVNRNEGYRRGSKYVNVDYGDVRKDRQNEFNDYIGEHIIRRTLEEVVPEMPPELVVDWPVQFEPGSKQERQYNDMADKAEAEIEEEEDEGHITASGVLAIYTRLKQFSDAYCTLGATDARGNRMVYPTTDSIKLPALMQILDERGILDNLGTEQVVIFSQFSKVVDMVHDYLTAKKVKAVKLTGGVTGRKRDQAIAEFQAVDATDRPRAICATTTAGGVSIELDNASTVVFLDETWDPDDQKQGIDRTRRSSKIHHVTVYKIYTEGTVEEYIRLVLDEKESINDRILDLRRAGFVLRHKKVS